MKEALRKIRNAYQINRNSEKVLLLYALVDLKAGIYSDAIEKTDIILHKNDNCLEAKFIKIHSLINIMKPQEALNMLCSLDKQYEEDAVYIYLSYLAYKMLVEENKSNYNESMLNHYMEKMDKINPEFFNQNGISTYIEKALNINKG